MIKLGTNDITKAYVGSSEVSKMYLGSDLVYSKELVLPYVTDGLVAMWDGIWNAGLGIHTQSDLEFKDLVSGNSVPVGWYGSWGSGNLDNNYSVESDGLKCNTLNKMIGIGIPFSFDLGYEYTIEYVRTITKFRTSNVGNCVSSHPYDDINQRILEHHNYQNYGFRIKGKTSTLANSGEWTVRNETTGVEKVSLRMSSDKLMTVMYNNTKYTRTIDIYLTNSYCTHLCFNTSGHLATLNCIRVYNRTLSDAEILQNYNIDVKRF